MAVTNFWDEVIDTVTRGIMSSYVLFNPSRVHKPTSCPLTTTSEQPRLATASSDEYSSRLLLFHSTIPPFRLPQPPHRAKSTLLTQNMSGSQPNSISKKRKLDVFVEIPPSPFHRSTPGNSSRPFSGTPLQGRRSQAFVDIPPPPLSKSFMKGTLNNGIRPSPLSKRAFNVNASTESPNKKPKLSMTAKQRDKEPEGYPNGYFRCHQCRRKFDNSLGLHCTILSKKRCKSKYCKPCLRNRYGQDIEAIKHCTAAQNGRHVSEAGYQWACPKCEDTCNCIRCRKSKGLPPTGRIPVQLQPMMPNVPLHTAMANVFRLNSNIQSSDAKSLQPEQPKTRAPRVKKPIREPKWTAVPTELDLSQAEDRFYIREFMLRFSPLITRVGVTHLEDLDLFDVLSRPCAKALIYGLLDLIVADAEPDEQKIIRETLKKISSSGSDPAVLWARLKILRKALPNDFFVVPIPDPASRPSFAEDDAEDEADSYTNRTSSRIKSRTNTRNTPGDEEVLILDNSVTHPLQLIPCIIALCECAMQGPSIRADIEKQANDAREKNRSYFSEIRKENERWAEERVSLGWGERKDDKEPVNDQSAEGTSDKGKAREKDPEKDKAYRTAYAAHKRKLATLENARMLELQTYAPRFGSLGRDSSGRVYYASSMRQDKDKRRKPKIPDEEDRTGLRKWGWFLAVWGPGGIIGPAKHEKEERWWGFADPKEIRQLAKWLGAAEGVDGKDTFVEGPGGSTVKGIEDLKKVITSSNSSVTSPELGTPTRTHVKALVKGINEYADLLEWRLGEEV
ncbi:uncharacterized protein FOMMEDRAFT_168333 [Fomitiporia mediterranea MF3/22]|uniref:uncharacterized protein n=1 Tax=Fomitiporia mediterranea (strain MF3/22) TaxID=694068 RepID=UPI0004407496|nr:uncharacterized protein FOMMEDRAFT_168333 [Fomitiporia mediterranea MF3/22]EJD03349.1 hypothetical protein FOMMEDRAFT_168333 [Fomitiporia mediterranea MF3/22]